MTPVAGERAPAEASQRATAAAEPAPAAPPADAARRALDPGAWIVAGFVLLALLYVAVVPPFESPDENSHYEYARLLGDLGRRPLIEERSAPLRAEVERYMLERGYGLLLPSPDGGRRLGFNDELQRQPSTYYWLPAALGKLAAGDLEWQVRAMRLGSVVLGTLVVVAAVLAGRVLFPDETFPRLALPLLVALTPGFAFIAASVNNDNLANAGAALAFLGLAVALRRGLTFRALALAIGGLALAISGKRTPVALVPAALLALYWIALLRARWPTTPRVLLALLPVALAVVAAQTAFEGGRRASGWQIERAADVSRVDEGLFGEAALRVAPGTSGAPGRLRQSLSAADVERAAETGLTAVAWVRVDGADASTPTAKARLQLGQGDSGPSAELVVADVWRPLRVYHRATTGEPVTVTLAVEGEAAVLVDGVVVALGERTGLPEADDTTMARGRWAGAPFANLAANGSAERADRELAPWLATLLEPFGAGDLLIASTDVARLTSIPGPVLEHRLWFVLQSYVGRFGWLVLPMPDLAYQVVLALAAVGVVGALTRLADRRAAPVVGLLVLIGAFVVAAATLPFLSGGLGEEWPQGRYLYTGIIPLSALVAMGLGRFLPPRLAEAGLAALAGGGLALNALALLGTIVPRYAGSA